MHSHLFSERFCYFKYVLAVLKYEFYEKNLTCNSIKTME